jgi:pimeloyl-ACP methyl ester carboxylesterase
MRTLIALCALLVAATFAPAAPAQEADAPTQEKQITVTKESLKTKDGVTIVYDYRGEGDTTLVFLHGWACNRTFFKHQLDEFAGDYKVVAIDLAGHGESGTSRDNWSILELAGDVEQVVEKLDLERVILVGHSMGGTVSLEAAARMPERVIGVVGVDTLHNAEFEFPEEMMQQFIAAMEANYEQTVRGMMAGMVGSNAELAKWIAEQALRTKKEVAVGLMGDFAALDYPGLFENADVPIRCVNSAPQGPANMPTEIEINKKYADFDAVLIEGTGHFPMLEKPEAFNEKLAGVVAEMGG